MLERVETFNGIDRGVHAFHKYYTDALAKHFTQKYNRLIQNNIKEVVMIEINKDIKKLSINIKERMIKVCLMQKPTRVKVNDFWINISVEELLNK